MLPVTQASLVCQKYDHVPNNRAAEDLRLYLRTEFGGDGAGVLQTATRKATKRAKSRTEGRGVLSGLFAALGSAFARPGGA